MTSKKNTEDGRPLLKMKELVEQAGVSKATILHYIQVGLLPQPVEKSRNMAWYHPDCVEKIRFIRSLQARYRLPLATIKGLVREREKGRYTDTLGELYDTLFGRPDPMELDLAGFCDATGLSAEEVQKGMDTGLIAPREKEKFDHEDLAVGEILKKLKETGGGMEELSFYGEIAADLSRREVAFRLKMTRDLPFEKDAALTLELSRNVRVLRSYVMDRAFQRRVMDLRGLKDDLSEP